MSEQLFYVDVDGYFDLEFEANGCLTFSVVNQETREASWAITTPETAKELYYAMKKFYEKE